MNKTLAITVIGLGLIALFAALIIAEVSQPPAWQAELDRYIAHVRTASGDSITITAIERARHPEAFAREQSRAVFGDDVYYDRFLPFPPERLRCILVQRTHPGKGSRRQILFAAFHQDLYHADWVIHEGASEPFDPDALDRLAVIGCNLGLKP
jgi:hypothetical protein